MALPFVNFNESLTSGQLPYLVHRDQIISIEACQGSDGSRSFTNGCVVRLSSEEVKLLSLEDTRHLFSQIGWSNLL